MSSFTGIEPYIIWGGGFSDTELDAIIAHGDSLRLGSATVKDDDSADRFNVVRNTKIAFIDQSSATSWLYDKIAAIVSELNGQTYRFDLSALERFQYTVYDAAQGGHYNWHMDQGLTARPRKLSLVLQLSSPSDYEGCALEIHSSARTEIMPKERGTLIAFPSYILHRVTPIHSGTRRSLVMWCSGPRFR